MPTHGADGLYIGLMSGTSTDGTDAVLARFQSGQPPQYLATASVAFPPELQTALHELNVPGDNEIHRAALASQAIVQIYAQAVSDVLTQADVAAEAIVAIGAHGQTVRHRPELGYTTQLNAPALLAERCGIAVVSDFRSRDVAAGGQGAPLVPAFHAALFSGDTTRIILNLGGIANITVLAPGKPVTGLDTGPANVLLDAWCMRHVGQPYDRDGAWAASGQVNRALLADLLSSEPWLDLAPPKSTGRDLFNMPWLLTRLAKHAEATNTPELDPRDVQATLGAFTAATIASAIKKWAPHPEGGVWVAGGGAYNPTLLASIQHAVGAPIQSTDKLGVPAQALEAYAFAWLAYAHCVGLAGNRAEVTGARGPRILGSYNPA